MYHAIVRRRARGIFERLSRGENEGAHWIRLRSGKGTYVRAYLETERVADACRRMAAAGIEEAAAPPITA